MALWGLYRVSGALDGAGYGVRASVELDKDIT